MNPATSGHDDVGRRQVLAAMTQFGAWALLPGVVPGCAAGGTPAPTQAPQDRDLIRRENSRPGSRDWLLERTQIDAASRYRSPAIEGYASRTSVRAGEELSFHASTNPPSPFRIDVYRTGFYQGAGARKVAALGPYRGHVQEEPPEGPRRRRECRWEPCETLVVPREWPSGVYLAKLTAGRDGIESYIVFVVRDDREADFIVQCSDTTWSAYNRWPSQYSLYDDGRSAWYWGAGVEVSFDRPYGKYCQIVDQPLSTGSGEWLLWEFPLSYWLESQGYDVTYVSNLDLHADPGMLRRARGFLSVGHDEYYSMKMFRNLKEAIAGGLSVAFLSGNTCCGLVEVLPSSDGRPHRVITRVDRFGPRDGTGDRIFTAMARLPRRAPNEASLIGARSTGPIMGGADWTCVRPDHWLFKGTGMEKGDGIPGLVGWEWHGEPAAIPGLEVVAEGTTRSGAGDGRYAATVYPGPHGNLVFNASTCWWADGLSEPPGYVRPSAHGARPSGPDPRVARITANLLARMSARG